MLSGSQDGSMKCWDLRTRSSRPILTLLGNADGVRDVKFSPFDAKKLVGIFESGVIQKWDMAAPQTFEKRFNAHTGSGLSIDWHPDYDYIVSGGRDKQIQVWNMSAADIRTPDYQITTASPISKVCWRPNDLKNGIENSEIANSCLNTDYSVNIWNLKRRHIVKHVIMSHTAPVTGIAFNSPNTLLSCSKDRTIFQHEVDSYPFVIEELQTHPIAWASINQLSFVCQDSLLKPQSSFPTQNIPSSSTTAISHSFVPMHRSTTTDFIGTTSTSSNNFNDSLYNSAAVTPSTSPTNIPPKSLTNGPLSSNANLSSISNNPSVTPSSATSNNTINSQEIVTDIRRSSTAYPIAYSTSSSFPNTQSHNASTIPPPNINTTGVLNLSLAPSICPVTLPINGNDSFIYLATNYLIDVPTDMSLLEVLEYNAAVAGMAGKFRDCQSWRILKKSIEWEDSNSFNYDSEKKHHNHHHHLRTRFNNVHSGNPTKKTKDGKQAPKNVSIKVKDLQLEDTNITGTSGGEYLNTNTNEESDISDFGNNGISSGSISSSFNRHSSFNYKYHRPTASNLTEVLSHNSTMDSESDKTRDLPDSASNKPSIIIDNKTSNNNLDKHRSENETSMDYDVAVQGPIPIKGGNRSSIRGGSSLFGSVGALANSVDSLPLLRLGFNRDNQTKEVSESINNNGSSKIENTVLGDSMSSTNTIANLELGSSSSLNSVDMTGFRPSELDAPKASSYLKTKLFNKEKGTAFTALDNSIHANNNLSGLNEVTQLLGDISNTKLQLAPLRLVKGMKKVSLIGEALRSSEKKIEPPWNTRNLILKWSEYCCQQGDIVTCATLSLLFSNDDGSCGFLSKQRCLESIGLYIEILHRLQLFAVSANIIKSCKHDRIKRMGQTDTALVFDNTKPDNITKKSGISNGNYTAEMIPAFLDQCILCRQPVKSFAFAILDCGHKGHYRCMKQYFLEEKMTECPAGCGVTYIVS